MQEDTVITGENASESRDGLREAIATLEKEFNAISTALLGTEEFARTAMLISNVRTQLQKALGNHMARQLERLNMPSRDDIAALGERMMSIDDRLIRVEEILRQVHATETAPLSNRPPRTKKPGARKTGAKKTKARSADAAAK